MGLFRSNEEKLQGKPRGIFQSMVTDKAKIAGQALDTKFYDFRGEGANFEKRVGLTFEKFKKQLMVIASRLYDGLMAQNEINAKANHKLEALDQLRSGKITDPQAFKEGIAHLDPTLVNRVDSNRNVGAKNLTTLEKANINSLVGENTKNLGFDKAFGKDMVDNINKNINAGLSSKDSIRNAFQASSQKFGIDDIDFSKDGSKAFETSMIDSVEKSLGDNRSLMAGKLDEKTMTDTLNKSLKNNIKEFNLDEKFINKTLRANMAQEISLGIRDETAKAYKTALNNDLAVDSKQATNAGIKNAAERFNLSEKNTDKVLGAYDKAMTPHTLQPNSVLGISPSANSQNIANRMKGNVNHHAKIDQKVEEKTGEKVSYKNDDRYGVNMIDKSAKDKKLDIKQFQKLAKTENALMKEMVGGKGENLAELSKGR